MEKQSSRPINTIACDCIAVRLLNRVVTNCYNEALILGPGPAAAMTDRRIRSRSLPRSLQ